MNQPRPLSDETLYASPERIRDFALECPKTTQPLMDEPFRHRRSRRPIMSDADDWLQEGELRLSRIVSALVVLLATLVLLVWWPSAEANDDVEHGLRLRDAQTGQSISALQLATDVDMRVSGMIARVRVVQRYRNPSANWQEGLYLFPLPERAAVDRMRIRIGERIIEGQIQEKKQARATYEKAKAAGQQTGLVQQRRANMFSTEVANIAPGETVEIEIEYQQTVIYQDGVFDLRFPMVVGPRYRARPIVLDQVDAGGWVPAAAVADEPVPEVPYKEKTDQRLQFQIELNAGLPLDKVESPYHPIIATPVTSGHYRIRLQEGPVAVDRDFVLRWRPTPSALPQAALFTEQKAGTNYALLMFVPPEPGTDDLQALAREVVYVIDTSGSMHGPSIVQAREALDLALTQMRAQDRFNVIQFNSSTEQLFRRSADATPENVRRARDYVARLQADGGTEMAPALEAALKDSGTTSMVRQVVFLTDGSVSNEQALFGLIQKHLGTSRLFTVGIGSAPNSHFMREAARYGRGTFTFIGDLAEVGERMGALFRKLRSPVLKDIEVEWPDGVVVDMQPDKFPDLYVGEPLVLNAKLPASVSSVRVSGQGAGVPWAVELPLQRGVPSDGVAVAWARAKLAGMEDRLGSDEGGQMQEVMTKLALEHHLVSRFTSLVAVDVTPVRPDAAALESGKLPLAMPAGWNYQKVFGNLPQTATPAALHIIYGLGALLGGAGLWGRRRREPC